MRIDLAGSIIGTLIFAVLVGIVSNIENPILRSVLSVVFYIALAGFGLISIILVAKMVWAAI